MAPKDARRKLEQMRRNRNKSKPKPVQDLRQLIKKKSKSNEEKRTNRPKTSTTNRPRIAPGPSRPINIKNNKRVTLLRPGRKIQQQYYVPPHLQHQQPTYIIAAAPPAPATSNPPSAPAIRHSKLAMDNVPDKRSGAGASVLVSNLIPSITQSEVIELFGDVGIMTAVNMINQTTALVTYQNSSDAVEAVKVYHNRLLDGKPMYVYMMPNSASGSNVRSRLQ